MPDLARAADDRALGSGGPGGLPGSRRQAAGVTRIKLFTSLPFDAIDSMVLQRHLDDIGRTGQ